MTLSSRILVVQAMSDDARAVLAALDDCDLLDQTYLARDVDEALSFLHLCAAQQRTASLPALVILGLDLAPLKSLHLLGQIRSHPRLHRVPVVMIIESRRADFVQRAYELGVNGIVLKNKDASLHADRLHAICQFWVSANVPPPGCMRRLDEERERA